MMKKTSALMAVVFAMGLCLTGCGKSEAEVSSVTIDKSGKITGVILEDFDKDYYSVDELEAMIEDEIKSYNAEYDSPRISLEETAKIEEGSFAKVAIDYESSDDYAYFNQITFFYGTIEEARAAGYGVSNSLVDQNGEKVDPAFIDEHPDHHVIITNDKTRVRTPYNIQYTTSGVTLNGKKEAVLDSAIADNIQLLLSK